MPHNKETNKARKEIRYLNKNFEQFRKSMVDFAKVYFPNTFNDFNEADPGMMFVEMASYVGDVLSYYVDSQLKESILTTAEERENVIQLAQAMGYMPRASVGSVVDLDIYQLLPAVGSGTNTRPDWRYAQLIKSGMSATSTESGNQSFKTLDDIDFAASSSLDPTDLTVYSVDSDGIPTYYLIKKKVKARSGNQKEVEFSFEDPEKFTSVLIPDTDVISIDSIIDSDGNEWKEVNYLAQDTVFEKVKNIPSNGSAQLSNFANSVPFLLKTVRVPRRFIKRLNSKNQYEIRFGAGVSSSPGATITPGPSNVGAGIGVSSLQQAWDPSNFLLTDAYGQVPQNTTLTVKYSTGGGVQSNVSSNTITSIGNLIFDRQMNLLDDDLVQQVRRSIACNNPSPATGGVGEEPTETIRQNTFANFQAQNRTVTKEDYELRCYTMPSHLGTIAKAYAAVDDLGVTNCETDEQLIEEINNLQKQNEECEETISNLNQTITDLEITINTQYEQILYYMDNAECPPCEATQEDVDNAYDTGYATGYTAGQGDCTDNSGGGSGDTGTGGSVCDKIRDKLVSATAELKKEEDRYNNLQSPTYEDKSRLEAMRTEVNRYQDEYKKCKANEAADSVMRDDIIRLEDDNKKLKEKIKNLENNLANQTNIVAPDRTNDSVYNEEWKETVNEVENPANLTDVGDGITVPDNVNYRDDQVVDYTKEDQVKFNDFPQGNIDDGEESADRNRLTGGA